jgi:hypothetical protein
MAAEAACEGNGRLPERIQSRKEVIS